MVRRSAVNKTGLNRIESIHPHHAWVGFICLKCSALNTVDVGMQLLDPASAYDSQSWKCIKCSYLHARTSDLPFPNWSKSFRTHKSLCAQRFWIGFFRICTEHAESYWKQCNACGRILPFNAFSKHRAWGPLERQMECRSCKGAINAVLNPKRTKEQLHEASVKRRIADLLLVGENQRIDHNALFQRFNGKCFKTGKPLDIKQRKTWEIDHILPSRYFYPLTIQNAALLSRGANENKRDQWPSHFYTNNELIRLAMITSADLSLLASKEPVVNKDIDVNACVTRFLNVRERSDLTKRILELVKLIRENKLLSQLSAKNKKLLGL